MIERIVHLYDYNVWANGRVIEHLNTLPDEVFHQEVDLGFNSIAEVVGHLITADEIWLARIKDEHPPILVPKPLADVKEAGNVMTRLQSEFRDYLASVLNMEKRVTYRNTKGQEFQNTIAEIVQHVVNHGTYHRGNITTILRSLGHPGTQTDYIAFLR